MRAWIIWFCISSLLACKSRKIVVDTVVKKMSKEAAFKVAENHNTDFEWYVAKAKINFQSPYYSESGSAFLRIRKDSVIWMVLKKYSLEGLRVQMDRDSVKAINRLDKTYISMSWQDVSDFYGIDLDYDIAENLISGNIEIPDSTGTYDIIEEGDFYKQIYSDGFYHYTYLVPFLMNHLTAYTIESMEGGEMSIAYADCDKNTDFCYLRAYNVPLQNEQEMRLRIEIKDLEIDVPKKIKFDIPSRYTKLN